MTHQDLLAWQQIAVYSTELNSADWTLIVPQDPRRVVLTIAVGARQNTYFVITPDTSNSPPTGIYMIGDSLNAVPFVTWNYRDHGIYTKCNWYAYAPSITTAFCTGVLMELDPCNNSNWGGSNGMGSKHKAERSVQPLSGRSNNGHRPVQPFAKAVGADIIAHVFKQDDARLRSRRDRCRRDNDLPWH